MNLEEKINNIINKYNADSYQEYCDTADEDGPAYESYETLFPIEYWMWVDEPQTGAPVHNQVNRWIEVTNVEICLTSPSEYIREYKKWQLRRLSSMVE